MATAGLTTEEQKAVDRFRSSIVEPSMTQLVIVDFWAEWCGPCKALTPVLEKTAADYADKGVLLAKINVDEEKFIAAQFQVRSIPTVYAMFQGQPVADLTSARTESQLKTMLDQLLAQLPVQPAGAEPEQDLAPLLAMGEEALADGNGDRAASIYAQIVEINPASADAAGGLARALIASGRIDEAQAVLDAIDPAVASDPAIERARAALALVADAPASDELSALEMAFSTNPDDHHAAFALANGRFASGDRDGAADLLLAITKAERDWNDGAARQRLLQMFEAIGLEDPWVSATRRRLSQALFG